MIRISCMVWIAGLMVAASAAVALAAEPAAQRPNIVVIIADDLGWNDVGYHGSEIQTPTLDKLAAGGVKLERHYVYPTCSPTRCGILTGRNPARFGIHTPIGGRSTHALPLETMTLAKALKSAGYETALVGKWHLGLRPEVGPRKYGFDQTYGYFHGQIDPLVHDYKNGDRSWHRNDEFVDEQGHATDLLAAEAVRFVSQKREKPFLLWAAFSVPHTPLNEAAEWTQPYDKSIADPSRRLYAGAVAHLDAAMGKIVTALEKTGQIDNTLILFTSDNGGQNGWGGGKEYEGRYQPQPTLGNNKPLRNWKGSLYEGGVRVPAFVYFRGKLQPGVVEKPVTLLDWLPTLANVAGVPVDEAWKLDGRNVWPLLAPAEPAVDVPLAALFWDTGKSIGLLSDNRKMIAPAQGKGPAQLYDLAADPLEEHDLAKGDAALQKEILERLQATRKLHADREP